jgi:hypothetical protein
VRRPVQEGHVAERLASQELERLRLDLENLFPLERRGRDELGTQVAVLGRVRSLLRERVLIGELRHDRLLTKNNRRGRWTPVDRGLESLIISRREARSSAVEAV